MTDEEYEEFRKPLTEFEKRERERNAIMVACLARYRDRLQAYMLAKMRANGMIPPEPPDSSPT